MPSTGPTAHLRKQIATATLCIGAAAAVFVGWLLVWAARAEVRAEADAYLALAERGVRGREAFGLPESPPGVSLFWLDRAGVTLGESPEETAYAPGRELGEALELGVGERKREGRLARALPMRDENGRLEGYVVVVLDTRAHDTALYRRLWGGFSLVLVLCATVWAWMWSSARPRLELLAEVCRLAEGDNLEPLRLRATHPFRPVADWLNRLTESLEKQGRLITEMHHRQQVLLNNISEGVLVLDNELNITGVNPIAAHWLEMGAPARARGKPLYKLCRNPTLLAMIDDLLGTGEMREVHLNLERAGEEDRLVQIRGSLLVDRDQTVGVLVLLQDVTTLRRLEILRQDFVANVSHELRTPLTSIKGYAELLADETGDPGAVARYGDKILAQSVRMVNIIDDLLALTRIESAAAPPSVAVAEIRPLLENVLALAEDAASRRNLSFSMEVEEDLRAPMHAPLIEQAVLNLVQNAVKYTHPATVITLRARRDQDQCVIEVADQGPGIEPRHQARVFERFYRVDKARSRAVGGTGLGLSIVKHIAQLHRGTVAVESSPGEGATFRLILPLREPFSP